MKKLNHWIHSVVDRKLLKFVAVGIVNTVVGTAIMFGLYNLAGCSYWVSSATNYTLTSILSFFLNKFFTFQNRQKSPRPGAALCREYLGLLSGGLRRGEAMRMLWALAGAGKTLQENLAMVVGMCLFTGLNYLGSGSSSFPTKRRPGAR